MECTAQTPREQAWKLSFIPIVSSNAVGRCAYLLSWRRRIHALGAAQSGSWKNQADRPSPRQATMVCITRFVSSGPLTAMH
jgi:hypothetical protein